MDQTIRLDFTPRRWQAETYRLLKRFNVLIVHRRAGKTVQAVMKLIDAALKFQKENGLFAYLAPELKQAKGVAWDYIKHYAAQIPGYTINEAELWVKFPNGAKVRIFGADNPNSLRGYRFDGAVIDEVAQMKRELWGEVLLPALSDRNGWALFIGTPQGVNLLSELYEYALRNPDEWYGRLCNIYETGVYTQAEIDSLIAKMSPGQFRQEYMCDFAASSDDILISLDEVNKARLRNYLPEQYMASQKRLGVDVAYFGGDETVIYCRQGLKAGPYTVLRGADTQQVADRVALAMKKTNAEIAFVDRTGIGAGVIDRLINLRVRAVGIDFGSKPTQDGTYFNKRAEMWYEMAAWIKRGGQLPDKDLDLQKELTVTRYNFKDGKIIIQKKEEIREALGRSPDHADALALTFAMIDMPAADPLGLGYAHPMMNQNARKNSDFDPHNVGAQPVRDWEPFGGGGL